MPATLIKLNINPTDPGATKAVAPTPIKLDINPGDPGSGLSPISQTYNSINSGGFASVTKQNASDYADKTDSDIQSSMMQSALLGVSNDEVAQNPIEALGKTAVNAAGDAWQIAKGLVTLPFHLDAFIKQAVQDPTSLLGPAAQQLTTGLESAIQTGDIGNLWKGAKSAANAVYNHPLESVLPFLGLAGEDAVTDAAGNMTRPASGLTATLKELGNTPIASTADAVGSAARGAADAITKPIDFIKNIGKGKTNPATDAVEKLVTPAQRTAALQNQMENIGNINEQLTQELQSAQSAAEALKGLTNAPQEAIEAANDSVEQAQAKLSSLGELTDTTLSAHLNSLQKASDISSIGNTPETIGPAISEGLLRNEKDVLDGYQSTVPSTGNGAYPSMQPVLDSLEEYRDRLTNEGTLTEKIQKGIDSWKNRFGAMESTAPLFKGATEPGAADIAKALYDSANRNKYGSGIAEIDPSLSHPVSASGLKTTLKATINDDLTGGSNSYGKVFGDTVGKAIEETVRGSIKDVNGDGANTHYDDLNSKYRALNKGALANKLQGVQTLSGISKFLRDPEFKADLEAVHPGYVDLMQKTLLKGIVESTEGNPGKLGDLLSKNKDVLNPNDYNAAKAISDHMQAQELARDAASKAIKDMGDTPEKIFSTIKSIKSIDDLNEFAKNAEMTPKQVGAIFMRSVFERIDPSLSSPKGVYTAADFKNIVAANKEIQSFGKGFDTNELHEAMFGKGKANIADQLDKASSVIEKATDTKTAGPIKRVAQVVTGGLLAHFGFLWSGLRFAKAGVEGLFGASKDASEGDTIPAKGTVKEPKAPGAVKRALKNSSGKLQAGAAAANAENNK